MWGFISRTIPFLLLLVATATLAAPHLVPNFEVLSSMARSRVRWGGCAALFAPLFIRDEAAGTAKTTRYGRDHSSARRERDQHRRRQAADRHERHCFRPSMADT